MPPPPPALFIASLGNPGSQYALTRHSAAHVVLTALASQLGAPPFIASSDDSLSTTTTVDLPAPPRPKKRKRPPHPPPAADGADQEANLQRAPPSPEPEPQPQRAQWTLWQSPTYMNTSGPPLLRAYRRFRPDTVYSPDAPGATPKRLVVLHDSLEHPPASVTVRANAGTLSAKGHNGIKSLLEAFGTKKPGKKGGGGEGEDWVKISIGIGRPNGRDPEEVSRYVLGRLSERELDGLRGKAVVGVLKALEGIR